MFTSTSAYRFACSAVSQRERMPRSVRDAGDLRQIEVDSSGKIWSVRIYVCNTGILPPAVWMTPLMLLIIHITAPSIRPRGVRHGPIKVSLKTSVVDTCWEAEPQWIMDYHRPVAWIWCLWSNSWFAGSGLDRSCTLFYNTLRKSLVSGDKSS